MHLPGLEEGVVRGCFGFPAGPGIQMWGCWVLGRQSL